LATGGTRYGSRLTDNHFCCWVAGQLLSVAEPQYFFSSVVHAFIYSFCLILYIYSLPNISILLL
jgi:hypothetical protein